ncbi:FAD-binding oxidoreductase [Amycolatopsis acidiphila]|uniref:FAD-binding oxidoreductase n=1 Tax=Amycolatopsis acidiphila TaxID=715473 RepID=A0A558AH87_9PSEU|nr:FAD-binding and (Fe-S)-binding domain-containing protein [Amycolatopsis acidiphila]TVT23634.1 FAD-binding oxidoreductase [Amycolatopsis acidiphila]UIJ58621.1 FAD-binding oxidoreductase [Amycolatopsis acidiphila]GHG76437.1 lactate dehydrogenase [Amycolatopsis acidiphila]
MRDTLRELLTGQDAAFDAGSLALYTTDASNYRHAPLGVVLPRTADDVVAAVAACRAAGAPVIARGGGTSIAGNACGPGLVLDTSRHLRGVLELDAQARTARVAPGTVLDDLQAVAAPHGLRFGPDPSTHSRCTIGGMIGNNACGSHSVAWGRTADNLESMRVLLYDGTRLTVGTTSRSEADRRAALPGTEGRVYRELRDLVDGNLALLRKELSGWGRRVSGYGLEHLLPENGFNVARALVGSEGTCVTVLDATVALVELPKHRALAVFGFDTDIDAADAVPAILAKNPLTVEGLDIELVGLTGARSSDLPDGRAWLMVELAGETLDEAQQRAHELARRLGRPHVVLTDPAAQRRLWRIREEGAGLATRMSDGSEAWPGWEDAAVPPERLGAYLREFKQLLARHGRKTVVYGHYGEGCLHMRIDFDLLSKSGIAGFRSFLRDAADLIAAHGGSLSGEHGDGQARSELLPRMYSPEMMALFERFKGIFDPDDRMNPGILVRPRPVDADLRLRAANVPVMLGYPHDDGSFAEAMRRCVGVGKCRNTSGGGVMCPSYRATREEKHSTRGRAHLLAEMINGELITDGWRSAEVRDALDLCLSCKGCLSDCPVDVDMATYKAEFQHQHYKGRLRPLSHYSMGWLPLWLRFSAVAPRFANAALRRPRIAALVKRVGGIAAERRLPTFADRPYTRSRKRTSGGKPVVLWPDSFNNYLTPAVLHAATEVLAAAGYDVVVPEKNVCCGLTWVSTGQLGVAKRVLGRTLSVLKPYLDAGYEVVGLEPSCTALFRGDLGHLMPGDETAALLAERTRTFAELLAEAELPLGDLDIDAVTQVHCHQHAELGFTADERLMARAGIRNSTLDSGCCGLAGNFGFERGHYDVSRAVAEDRMLPAIREADPDTVVISDGFSCRTQIAQESDRTAVHLAELVAQALRRPTGDVREPEGSAR